MLRRVLGVALVAACQATKSSNSISSLAVDTDALSADEAPRRQSSLLHVRRGSQEKKPDMSRMVAMMEKLAKGLESEQAETKSLQKSRAKECRAGTAKPEKAIKKGKELIKETKNNLETYQGDQKSLQSTIDGMKKQITSAMSEVDTLTAQLKKLRKSQKKAAKKASASLQQIDRVIQKEYRLEKEAEEHPNTTPKPTGINAEVNKLQELSSQLDQNSASSAAAEDAPADDDVSFVQTGLLAELEAGAADLSENVGAAHQLAVLRADKAELVKARERAKKGFNEEEKKLIDLLKIKHEEVEKLEASLREQQPILADKLKQASETERAMNMAERVLARDQLSLALMKEKCKVTSAGSEKEAKLRFQLINLIKMPAKLLEGMDAMLFLAKDLQDLGGQHRAQGEPLAEDAAPSFVQVEASTSSADLGDAMQAALKTADDQEAKAEGEVPSDQAPADQQSSASTQTMQMAMQMQQQVAMVQEENGETAAGPFDKVAGMIKALMTSLRDQANEEMDLHQWCMESEAKNKKDRQKIRATMDETATEIHWAKSGIAGLDDQINFFTNDIKSLTDSKAAMTKEKSDELGRMKKYLSDHSKPIKALEKVVVVLRQQCSLSSKDLKLVQTSQSKTSQTPAQTQNPAMLLQDAVSGQGQSRRGQCLEAAKLVVEALAKFDELDKAIKKYSADFGKVATLTATVTGEGIDERNKALRSAKADKAKRTSDQATAENDQKQSEKDLALVEKAKQQQEQKCQKKDTREDRMARRAEEIGALKSALKVMQGEEIPVESLAQTGAESHTVHT